jgi:hypothetical protein
MKNSEVVNSSFAGNRYFKPPPPLAAGALVDIGEARPAGG